MYSSTVKNLFGFGRSVFVAAGSLSSELPIRSAVVRCFGHNLRDRLWHILRVHFLLDYLERKQQHILRNVTVVWNDLE